MKRLALIALLIASPAMAQQKEPAPIPVSQVLLLQISNYLANGGSHNEGLALNQSLATAVNLNNAQAQVADKDKQIAKLTEESDPKKIAEKAAKKEADDKALAAAVAEDKARQAAALPAAPADANAPMK